MRGVVDVDFIEKFNEKIEKYKPTFEITGLLTRDDMVYPFGTDTKVLSTIFELFVRPFIFEIAKEHNLKVFEPEQQNFYPDFTLMSSETDKNKIAVDVKTTYRTYIRNGEWRAKFTLGSFVSFLRSETKNIAFPLSDYKKHYIIGFIYSRVEENNNVHVYDIENRGKVQPAINNVEFFVQEKYKVASDGTGSGNTENIGSITGSSIEDFAKGRGTFAELGEDVFLDYWRNFPRYKAKGGFRNLSQYLAWKEKQKK